MADTLGPIMAYEDGQLDKDQTIKLFSALIKNGMAWKLQGHYGRTASALIKAGFLNDKGEVLDNE